MKHGNRNLPERILDLTQGRNPPEILHFHLSNRCNLACRFCARRTDFLRNDRLAERELGDDRWKELTLDACDLGVRHITITGGGEPLMRPVAFDMMERIKSRSVRGDLVTNGTLLDEEGIERMVACGWDDIEFSIHSPTPERSDFLRGSRNALARTLKNVETINRFKTRLGSPSPNLTFFMVITEYNVGDIADMVDLAAAYREMAGDCGVPWGHPTVLPHGG